jgi:hypothetical protein
MIMMVRAVRTIAVVLVGLAWMSPPVTGDATGQEKANISPTPQGYPTVAIDDPYSETPFAQSYDARRKAYCEFQVRNPGNGPYSEAARIALGQLPDERVVSPALDHIDARQDCADFQLHGILRLLYQFGDSPLVSEAFRARARTSVLNFKYWPDEPGIDSMCTWSENHFILFAAGGYLAGQLYPDATFTNSGRSGREQMAIFRGRILRWLDLRYRTGFSEWLSNVYYEEDLTALLNLIDFCHDEEIRQRATMVADLLLADMALNSFHGAFGSTHGRSYERQKKWARSESTGAISKLLFGMNRFHVGNMAATCLALSPHYRMPRVLYEIAADLDRPEMINRQRMGIRLRDAKKFGLDFHRLEDGMTFFSQEAYTDPKTINLTVRMFNEYNWWENKFFAPFKKHRQLIETAYRWHFLSLTVWYYKHDVQRNQREEANIYTYRTPDYMLSTAQDYRRGYGGDQQHVWQATLGPGLACFTTHPAPRDQETPNYWAGSGSLPRVGQIKNVVIAVYKISTKPGLYLTNKLLFTHAWFPKDQFDEVFERAGWVLARHGDAYLALWSRQPYRWQEEEGEDKDREIIAPGKENIWICELGRRAADGDFTTFMDRIARSPVRCSGLSVVYDSPSQGLLEFGWFETLRQNGCPVMLADYPRYDNPYAQADFPAGVIAFRHNGQSLALDWATLRREANAYCDE